MKIIGRNKDAYKRLNVEEADSFVQDDQDEADAD